MPVITHMAAVRREIISMSVESFTPTALQFTHGAAHKVKSLVDEEGNDLSLIHI